MYNDTQPLHSPLELLDEWFYAAEHGKVGVGWKFGNHLVTTFSEMHKMLEQIMGRPVWTSEMAKSNQENLRRELQIGEKGFSFIEQMKKFKEEGKLIIVTHDETGEDLSQLKQTLAKGEQTK